MNRITFFIDGFNLYHSLANNQQYRKYKWLNLYKLAEKFITKNDKIENIYYFTALATWDLNKVQRHKIYVKALESQNIKVVYGKFKRKDKTCRLCHRTYHTFEEKQTDVNIAIYLFELAYKDEYDTAVILSGDSDLIPSIRAIRSIFPSKLIWTIIPIGRNAEELKNFSDKHMKIKEYHLRDSLFPDEIDINGIKIICPPSWK